MGIQKYRFDRTEEAQPNGAIRLMSDWQFGPSLAGVRNCPCSDGIRRTAYVQGEADTWFSIPAAVQVRGRAYKGYLTGTDEGLEFRFYDAELAKLQEADKPVDVRRAKP